MGYIYKQIPTARGLRVKFFTNVMAAEIIQEAAELAVEKNQPVIFDLNGFELVVPPAKVGVSVPKCLAVYERKLQARRQFEKLNERRMRENRLRHGRLERHLKLLQGLSKKPTAMLGWLVKLAEIAPQETYEWHTIIYTYDNLGWGRGKPCSRQPDESKRNWEIRIGLLGKTKRLIAGALNDVGKTGIPSRHFVRRAKQLIKKWAEADSLSKARDDLDVTAMSVVRIPRIWMDAPPPPAPTMRARSARLRVGTAPPGPAPLPIPLRQRDALVPVPQVPVPQVPVPQVPVPQVPVPRWPLEDLSYDDNTDDGDER